MAYGMGDYALKPRSGCSELYPPVDARIVCSDYHYYVSADGVWKWSFKTPIRARIAFLERARIMAYGMGVYALKPRSGCSELYPLRGARIAVCGGRPYASADGVWTLWSGLVTLAPKSPNSIRARITAPALG